MPQKHKFIIQLFPIEQCNLSVVFLLNMESNDFVLTWSTFYTTGIKVNEIKLGPQPLELI